MAIKIRPNPFVKPQPRENRVGRPSSGKVVISLRMDPDVIEKFRSTGPGWQARINDALKAVKIP